MREIAHVSDSAIDHIEALLAILLSLQLDPGSWGRRRQDPAVNEI